MRRERIISLIKLLIFKSINEERISLRKKRNISYINSNKLNTLMISNDIYTFMQLTT